MKINIKTKILIAVVIIFSIILIIASYFLLKEIIEYKISLDLNNNLIKDVVDIKDIDDRKEEFIIDWQEINKINSDIIGWIKIDDTSINYPILKDDNNLKYLYHSFDKSYNRNGSIFTIDNNPFLDNKTTIYGHNMKSGLMFSDLKNYLDKNFFMNHQEFIIYTKNQNYIAKVFSAYSIGTKEEENNIKNLNYEEEIKYYKEKSVVKVEEKNIENIVKLSTCSYINNHVKPTNHRYYIVAKIEKIS